MSDKLLFPKTFKALQSLQQQFNCKSCGQFADNPCTLGGCEHIFCNVCCEKKLENNECPVCNVHVSVKNAQINRQIFNLARLCKKLEADVTINEKLSNKNGSCDTFAVQTEPGSVSAIENSKSKNIDNMYSSTENYDRDLLLKKGRGIFGENGSSSNKRKSEIEIVQNASVGRKRRSPPTDQRTMTQLFSHNLNSDDKEMDLTDKENDEEMDLTDEENERLLLSGVRKTKFTSRKGIFSYKTKFEKNKTAAVDQTTMSQFFDYMDEDVKTDVFHDKMVNKIENVSISENPVTGNRKLKKTVKKNLKTKNVSRNLRVRSKETKLNNLPVIDSPCSRVKTSRRHSLGAMSNRVQELTDERHGNTPTNFRRSLSPVQQRGSGTRVSVNTSLTGSGSPVQQRGSGTRVGINMSLTGSGKKSTHSLLKRNAKGETQLQIAAIKGDFEKIEELLKAGATPNTRDNAGWTPLHEAAHYGHTHIAKMLIDHGAMINVPGTENDTPLHDALRQGKLDCVRLLVSRGACISSRNIHGYTPEDFAVTDDMKAALSTNITITPRLTEAVDVLEYQQPCLLTTALSREQRILVQKCTTVIQGRVVEDFSPEVTHIITSCNKDGMCARTFKYMYGVVSGKWIVNFDWVSMCIEFGSKVCEEAFEIPGSSQNIDSHAAEKARINRKNQLPQLFDGYQFYFQGNFDYPTPDKDDLIDLVKFGGGQILTREPKQHLSSVSDIPIVPYHAPTSGTLSKCSILVVRDNNSKFEPIRSEIMCSVSVAWLLECVGMFKILDL